MKAFILAAGFGTRLLPYTQSLPKPLFTLLSRPVLEHTLRLLEDIGCDQVFINTHHLHHQIETFISHLDTHLKIQLIYEPDVLETGGGILNARHYLHDQPFFVINADIISDIDLNYIYDTHCKSDTLATLVLHDFKRFNTIAVDDDGYIKNFTTKENSLAFTGVQVLSPEIYNYFPDKIKFSSIEVYKALCPQKKINACVLDNIFWSDIGTAKDYQKTSALLLCAAHFNLPFNQVQKIKITGLAGDGSDRKWFRASVENRSLILSDHGICLEGTQSFKELEAFIHIDRHLASTQIPVPRILDYDKISGLVTLEDLGDTHLADLIQKNHRDETILKTYKKVIDQLIAFSTRGLVNFNPDWTCQTRTYSKELILEKECRYFLDRFVNEYSGLNLSYDSLEQEFNHIADHALIHGYTGLMHRDMQSKNIMVNAGGLYFIDFQSARQGPLQYDLASLLIDPYVNLNADIQNALFNHTINRLQLTKKQAADFEHSYHYCCLTRNLQFLGAFSFLSRQKNKTQFERYIPEAVNSLIHIITIIGKEKLPVLYRLIQTIKGRPEKNADI